MLIIFNRSNTMFIIYILCYLSIITLFCVNININNIRLLSEVKEESVKSITLSFAIEQLDENIVEDLMEYIRSNPGKSKIQFNIRDIEHEFTISLVSLDFTINITQSFIDYIKELPGFEYKLN